MMVRQVSRARLRDGRNGRLEGAGEQGFATGDRLERYVCTRYEYRRIIRHHITSHIVKIHDGHSIYIWISKRNSEMK